MGGVKEGGLFNVQPMSKWDTIFFLKGKEGRRKRWLCGGGLRGCRVEVQVRTLALCGGEAGREGLKILQH